MLKMILMVPVIMACATGGTIGLIKVIRHFSSNLNWTEDPAGKTDSEDAER